MDNAIRPIEEALGSGKKVLQAQEKELRKYAHRSIQAIKERKKGDRLSEGKNSDTSRPGKQKTRAFILDIWLKTKEKSRHVI